MIATDDLRSVLQGIIKAGSSDETGYDRDSDLDADELEDFYEKPSTRR